MAGYYAHGFAHLSRGDGYGGTTATLAAFPDDRPGWPATPCEAAKAAAALANTGVPLADAVARYGGTLTGEPDVIPLRDRLASLGHTQAAFRRLMIKLGDRRSERAIETAITRALAELPGDDWIRVVLSLLERERSVARQASAS